MVNLQILETRDVSDFERAFRTAIKQSASGVMVLPAPLTSANAGLIAELALHSRLPTVGSTTAEAKAGELIVYGPDFIATFLRAPYFVDRILKGAKPGDLPVEQPTKFELVINLKAAKTIGLTVPPSLLSRADEVIE